MNEVFVTFSCIRLNGTCRIPVWNVKDAETFFFYPLVGLVHSSSALRAILFSFFSPASGPPWAALTHPESDNHMPRDFWNSPDVKIAMWWSPNAHCHLSASVSPLRLRRYIQQQRVLVSDFFSVKKIPSWKDTMIVNWLLQTESFHSQLRKLRSS